MHPNNSFSRGLMEIFEYRFILTDAPKAAGLSTGALSGIIVVIVVFILATIIFGIFLGRKIYRERVSVNRSRAGLPFQKRFPLIIISFK